MHVRVSNVLVATVCDRHATFDVSQHPTCAYRARDPFATPRQQVALIDPALCASLSNAQTVAMALTAISTCVDALLAWELASSAGKVPKNGETLLKLGVRGIGAVAEGLPVALADSKDILARELLTTGSVCAGQLSAITHAPPTQVRNCSKVVVEQHNRCSSCSFLINQSTTPARISQAGEKKKQSRLCCPND